MTPYHCRRFIALGVLWACAARAEDVTYVLARKGQAEIRFSVEAPLDTITGISNALVGAAQLDFETGAATARMVADLNAFQTGIALRDEDLRDQFFETGRYPSAVLEINKVTWKNPPRANSGASGNAMATLSLHGVNKTFSFPITVQPGELKGKRALSMRASFDLKLSDFNIQRPRKLFLKLGDTANVVVSGTLVSTVDVAPVVAEAKATVASPAETAMQPAEEVKRVFVPIAQVEKAKPPVPKFRFAAHTLQGKGERLFQDAKVGGPGNTLRCDSCHSVADERLGIFEGGKAKPSRTLYDAAKRPTLWQGLSKTIGAASSLCARLFMLSGTGLNAEQQTHLTAYLTAIAPNDTVPNLNYEVLALTRRTDLARPTEGNRVAGEAATTRFCVSCHSPGKMRPPLTPGLYEPDYLVRRVRWLPGHDAHQMPPMYIDRLTDSDLRNIVTYLAGDKSKRIFERKRVATSAEKSELK